MRRKKIITEQPAQEVQQIAETKVEKKKEEKKVEVKEDKKEKIESKQIKKSSLTADQLAELLKKGEMNSVKDLKKCGKKLGLQIFKMFLNKNGQEVNNKVLDMYGRVKTEAFWTLILAMKKHL